MATSSPTDADPPDAFEERRLEQLLAEETAAFLVLLDAREMLDRPEYDQPRASRARQMLGSFVMETKARCLDLEARLTTLREARL